jgi:RHS repeat-associated protein
VYFLHDDRLGTPQVATDASQTIQWTASYQPFGATNTGIGLIVQDLRLPGQEYDSVTGWNHNGFRDYAPGLGRYLESDPIGLAGGLNTYTYATNNPIAHTDRSGLAPLPLEIIELCFRIPACARYLILASLRGLAYSAVLRTAIAVQYSSAAVAVTEFCGEHPFISGYLRGLIPVPDPWEAAIANVDAATIRFYRDSADYLRDSYEQMGEFFAGLPELVGTGNEPNVEPDNAGPTQPSLPPAPSCNPKYQSCLTGGGTR